MHFHIAAYLVVYQCFSVCVCVCVYVCVCVCVCVCRLDLTGSGEKFGLYLWPLKHALFKKHSSLLH